MRCELYITNLVQIKIYKFLIKNVYFNVSRTGQDTGFIGVLFALAWINKKF